MRKREGPADDAFLVRGARGLDAAFVAVIEPAEYAAFPLEMQLFDLPPVRYHLSVFVSRYIPFWIGACVIFASLIVTSGQRQQFFDTDKAEMAKLNKCFQSGVTSAPEPVCLHEAIRGLISGHSAKEILDYASASSSAEEIVSNCHDIGHVLGEELVNKTGTLEYALEECSRNCNNGCIHGAIGAEIERITGPNADDIAHANVARIIDIGPPYCQKSAVLCHGIGHELFMSSHSYQVSLSGCTDVATPAARENCYQGVFMEGFGSELSLHFTAPSIPTNEIEYLSFCLSFPLTYQHACFRYLPGLYAESASARGESIASARFALLKGCATLSGVNRRNCFEGAGYDGGNTQGDFNNYSDVEKNCASLPEMTDLNTCTLGLIEKFVNYNNIDAAHSFCISLSSKNQHACLGYLASAYKQHTTLK